VKRVLGLAVLAALAYAAPASATAREVTMTQGPYEVGGYQVRLSGAESVPTPQVDGYITKMAADVVDVKTGKAVPISRIMLHHIVFMKEGAGIGGAFYGDGEERARLDLPPGYGYPIARDDRWRWVWMLMNHQPTTDRVLIRYRMTIVTDEALTPVVPVGFDTSRLRQGLVFDVPGGGAPGSLDVRTMTRPAPVAGRLVAGLGHVHGGARDLTLSEPGCGDRVLYRSTPTWGLASHPFYQVRPVLHEPGPINMSQFRSVAGIPVAAGELLTLTSRYDNERPHTRAMGLMVAYLAPDPALTEPCGPLPADVEVLKTTTPGRAFAPISRIRIYDWNGTGTAVQVPGPPGRLVTVDGDATVVADDQRFATGNLSVPAGATVSWSFPGAVVHNVTVADGPEGFSSNRLAGGATYAKQLTRPGTYTLFCELHPVGMVERIVVRPR
jgi:plastocyanin